MQRSTCVLVFLAALAVTSATAAATAASGLDLVLGTYQQCEGQADALACLKLQAIKVLHRALSQESLPLADGLALVRAEGTQDASAAGAREDQARALPFEVEGVVEGEGDAGRRQERLDTLLADHIGRLFRSRVLSLSLPRLLSTHDDDDDDDGAGVVEDARKEGGGGGGGGGNKGGKKNYGALMLAMLMKGGMIAYAYKSLALLAGKALLVAKVALVLAGVIGLSHLLGHKDGGTTYEVVKHPLVSHAFSHSQAVLPSDDHHHFDVTAAGHAGGFSGGVGVGGGIGGGAGGGGYGGGHGWGRVGVGRSLYITPASPAPASQLDAPESAAATAANGTEGTASYPAPSD